MSADSLLLDTHAAIWLSEGSLSGEALARIVAARLVGRASISPVTAWEAGLLASRGRYAFTPDPSAWYAQFLGVLGLKEAGLTSRILLDSTTLPWAVHNDPADRMLIATARALDCALMTRDVAIHAYAAQGHVAVVPC
jgi:PIN domain nuclease of toxin-antitoxin system